MKEKNLTAIVVDDEQHARNLLAKVLDFFEHSIELVGEASNLPGAIKLIHDLQPDIVFMDIEMPQYSGLQIHDFFKDYHFKLVFITAHDNFAIEAMRIKAFDYLVKPIELEQLKACVSRLEADHIKNQALRKEEPSNKKSHLEVHSLQGINYIPLESIYFLEASSMYTIIHGDEEKTVISKPLKDFEYLKDLGFYRTHRSFMVNTSKIKRFLKVDANEVELINGKKLAVSRSKKEAFIQHMTQSFKAK